MRPAEPGLGTAARYESREHDATTDDGPALLVGDEHAAALLLEGAHLFEPMDGRPMKAWVQVPPTHETPWADLARKAEAGLGS